jgi:hypothetical protein
MKIDNNILAVSKCIFSARNNWKHVTDQQKEDFFFIFNRYFSKEYPEFSQMMNDKNQDKRVGMDLWFHFMEGKPYPDWFWSKSGKEKNSSGLTDKEINLLMRKFQIKFEELEILISYYPDEVKEELKYIKETSK